MATRICKREILQHMSRTGRQEWWRGLRHRYVGKVECPEYRWVFTWDAWTYRTPRARESVLVLARHTAGGRVRIVHVGGVLAARILEERR